MRSANLNIKFLYSLFFCLLATSQASLSQTTEKEPVFQLNHVDICIDSLSFDKILSNSFLRNSFAFIKVFKDSTGSEILLLGKESFIHLLPVKGFFINRTGACLLVHHSFKWKETSTLKDYLQTFTQDSLYNRPYYSQELSIDYINVYEKLTEGEKALKFIPILQNHSKKDYLSWGYSPNDMENGISQTKYMNDYVGKETAEKLFQDIIDISITATKKELGRIQPLLEAYGYTKAGNNFTLKDNPVIHVSKMKANMRVVRLTILLSKFVDRKTILISDNASLLLRNNKATFTYKISDNNR